MDSAMGCDVSKDWVDVHGPTGMSRIDNNLRAARLLARQLPKGTRIGMEATGQLHCVLAQALAQHGHVVYVINPRWIHNYAKGLGLRGKTDRTDAALIARFVSSEGHGLHPYVPPTREQQQLRTLILQRKKLVQLKVATHLSLGAVAKPILAQFEMAIAKIELAIKKLIATSPSWKSTYGHLLTQPGVGPVVASHLVEVLTRIPFSSQDAFIAHTGLDPRACDSGLKRGRRRLTGHGDAALRSVLYIAAMAACQRDPWRPYYQAQLAKGLPRTAALVVLARKLARVAFTLFKGGKDYRAPVRQPTGA